METRCHCGNVRLTLLEPPATLTRCNCSICNRYGALWGYYPPDAVAIAVGQQGTSSYCWGDQCVNFIFCVKCGCCTHYTTTEKCDEQKVGVNFRMASPESIAGIRVRDLDGANTWQFLN